MRQSGNLLENLGFERGEDLAHRKLVEFVEPEEYREEAYEALDGVSEVFADMSDQIEDFADRWNPNGFMVFPLGIHHRLGSLRLHVYPEGNNRELKGKPEIHSHAWHLASLALGPGDYRDHIYTLDDEPNSDSDTPHRIYQSRRDENGVDHLKSDESDVFPRIVETRVIKPGQKHFIPAGLHHAPIHSTLPTSTIVLDSHAFSPFTEIVRPTENNQHEATKQRIRLTDRDILLAKSILSHLRPQG